MMVAHRCVLVTRVSAVRTDEAALRAEREYEYEARQQCLRHYVKLNGVRRQRCVKNIRR